MKRALRPALLSIALAASLGSVLPSSPADAAGVNEGMYYPLAGKRLGDTRTTSGFGRGRLLAGQTANLTVLGKGGIPTSGVAAVAVNVTATRSSGTGHVRAYPAGTTRPNTSVLNYGKDWTGASTVILKPGSGGKLSFYAGTADVDLVVDVVGWFASASSTTATVGSSFVGNSPYRIEDTRWSGSKLGAGQTLQVEYDWPSDIGYEPKAMMLNVTATGATAMGWLGPVSPSGATPGVSTLNYTAGVTSPNLTMVPTRRVGEKIVAGIYNGGKSPVHVVVDDAGWFYNDPYGDHFIPMTPTRIVDSRNGTGTTAAPIGPNQRRSFTKLPTSLKGTNVSGFMGALTGVRPTAGTYLTIWDGDPSYGRPTASNINLQANVSRSNGLSASFRFDDDFNFVPAVAGYNYAGNTDVLIDVTGRWEQWSPTASAKSLRAQRSNAMKTAVSSAVVRRVK